LKEEQSGIGQAIKWNFTKFLIDREGNVVERFAPQSKPTSFEDQIVALL
ncbi:MAG TPA: glutathione peroxidase, partial [Atopostipes sp.]|nr:glutathione peroxidase [Atopostipes sp.]